MLGFGFLWVGGFVFCIMLFLLGPSICRICIIDLVIQEKFFNRETQDCIRLDLSSSFFCVFPMEVDFHIPWRNVARSVTGDSHRGHCWCHGNRFSRWPQCTGRCLGKKWQGGGLMGWVDPTDCWRTGKYVGVLVCQNNYFCSSPRWPDVMFFLNALELWKRACWIFFCLGGWVVWRVGGNQ